eukprot:COSAG01_NODE_1080_length_11819_cov_29.816212_6_plen_128_part_00
MRLDCCVGLWLVHTPTPQAGTAREQAQAQQVTCPPAPLPLLPSLRPAALLLAPVVRSCCSCSRTVIGGVRARVRARVVHRLGSVLRISHQIAELQASLSAASAALATAKRASALSAVEVPPPCCLAA